MSACTALIVLLGPVQGQSPCDTQAGRDSNVAELEKRIDSFLSIVEEVPEGVARQFREIKVRDDQAFQEAVTHPLWLPYNIREGAAKMKRELKLSSSPSDITRGWRTIRAINALSESISFRDKLSEYAQANPDRRIVDVRRWRWESALLPAFLAEYARCLSDDMVLPK
jgi:hypothetical protein